MSLQVNPRMRGFCPCFWAVFTSVGGLGTCLLEHDVGPKRTSTMPDSLTYLPTYIYLPTYLPTSLPISPSIHTCMYVSICLPTIFSLALSWKESGGRPRTLCLKFWKKGLQKGLQPSTVLRQPLLGALATQNCWALGQEKATFINTPKTWDRVMYHRSHQSPGKRSQENPKRNGAQ